MSIFARNNSKPVELIPAGNYLARAYQMIELGTITENVMGKFVTHPKVRIGWELPTEMKVFNQDRGPQPLVISQEYTLSMNEKSSLRKMLASWRGKDFTEDEAKAFDITKLLGIACMLNVIHKPKKAHPSSFYQTIAGITPVPKGVKVPVQINKTFLLSYDNFEDALFDSLPDFIKRTMQDSEEFKKMYEPNVSEVKDQGYEPIGEDMDGLPF